MAERDELRARVGREFQRGTRYSARRFGRQGRSAGPMLRVPDRHVEVRLPSPETSDGPGLWESLRRRRSIREYGDAAVGLSVLSQLLWAAQGVTARRGPYALRTAPSAGALYPVETYLAVNRVERCGPGVYRYLVGGHALRLEREGEVGSALSRAALGQAMCGEAATTFIWSAVVERCACKDAGRAYRYIYLDAGHIAQNVALAAGALGLGACAIGAFFDDEVNALIGADGEEETTIYMMCVGAAR